VNNDQLDLDFTAPPVRRPAAGKAKPAEMKPEAPPPIETVRSLTRRIRECLEGEISSVWVCGEISNLRIQPSGHCYMTLKDADAQISAVLFARTRIQISRQSIQDGQEVEVYGRVSVYEPRGQYQLVIQNIRQKGIGQLQAKFEALKEKLAAEGLFDPSLKRPIPRFPKRVGVVTSVAAAAIRDFLNVLHRRHAGIEVLIFPVRVQGDGAAAEIAEALDSIGSTPNLPAVDLIVLTRGGGSIEDLWQFNEEVVVRAIRATPVPVISAVGHEIDFTISDFAADLRAPTPSAAAELVAAELEAVRENLDSLRARMSLLLRRPLDIARLRLQNLALETLERPVRRRLEDYAQRLDRSVVSIQRAPQQWMKSRSSQLEVLNTRLDSSRIHLAIGSARERLESVRVRILAAVEKGLAEKHHRLDIAHARMKVLNPQAVLERGFTLTRRVKDGKLVTSPGNLQHGELIETSFAKGTRKSRVE